MVHESTEKWHMYIHVCTLTRLCARIKHTNPVSQLVYTYMYLVSHLLQGGAEYVSLCTRIYRGDISRGSIPACQMSPNETDVYLCDHVVHIDVQSRNNKSNKLRGEQDPYPPT